MGLFQPVPLAWLQPTFEPLGGKLIFFSIIWEFSTLIITYGLTYGLSCAFGLLNHHLKFDMTLLINMYLT